MSLPRSSSAPSVTVVTTAHNAERYIGEAIESVLSQTFRDFEYVIVDDASDDSTVSIVERYVRADDRLRVVRRSSRGGPYAAANEGFANARAPLVARLDADDISLPRRLERQVEFLASNPGLRACATEVDLLVDGEVREMVLDALPTSAPAQKWRACVREMFFPSTTLVERSAWEEVGGFRDLALSQDLRFWCDLARRDWLGVVPEPLVYWRRHESQLSIQRQQLQEQLAMDVIRDHLQLLDGTWTAEDTYRLRWAAFRPVGLLPGRRVLARFEQLWRNDATLDERGRSEMSELMKWLRRRHLRVSAKTRLGSRSWGERILKIRTSASAS